MVIDLFYGLRGRRFSLLVQSIMLTCVGAWLLARECVSADGG